MEDFIGKITDGRYFPIVARNYYENTNKKFVLKDWMKFFRKEDVDIEKKREMAYTAMSHYVRSNDITCKDMENVISAIRKKGIVISKVEQQEFCNTFLPSKHRVLRE